MEDPLQQKDASRVWRGLNTISGPKKLHSQAVGDQSWANDLNLFFKRFDQSPPFPRPSQPCCNPFHLDHQYTAQSPAPFPLFSAHLPQAQLLSCHWSNLSFTPRQVRKELKKIKARKAAGPDGINSTLLKFCAVQLCGVMGVIPNMSLKLGRAPQLWKTSCVVAVPKTQHAKDLNSYRPVALTSHLMKILQRLALSHLRPVVRPTMGPLQFAYRPRIRGG